jgi:putative DNA primase/helicase
VRRFAGYSLTGSTRERAFAILHGTGKNGKSTLVELLRDALGDYAANTDTETVLRKRYSGVSNDVAALKGARFVSAAEVEQGRALAESKVKNLTGSDTVTARFLFAEPFDFRPEFKLWLSTNNKPVIHGTDDAIWGRIKLIPFTRRFEGAQADAELPEKLRAELPGVLVWMVRGCLEWLRDGLGEPEAVRKATGDYRTEMDSLAAFVEDECVVRPDAWCKFADLYAAYVRWCEDSNEAAEKKRQFGMRLTERGFEKAAGTGNVKIRKGIALRHDPGHDPSKVTDPDPEDGPEERETPPDAGTIGNRVTDRAENSDSRNTCKTADSGERVADSYRKSKTLAENPPRREGFENTVTKGNSVTPGPENDPVKPLNEALTSDEVQRERGLVREGMKPEIARREVLSKRRKT